MTLFMLTMSAAGQAQQLQNRAEGVSAYLDPTDGLSLDDAIARALTQEPSLRASRSRIDVTRGLREQAGLRPNPAVSFSQQQEPSGSDNQTRIELQWPLDLFRKAGRIGVADREIDVARHAAANRERTLITDRVERGAAPPLDRDILRVEVQRLEADRLVQAGAVERRLFELKRVLGMPPDAPVKLRESLETLVRRDPPRPSGGAADAAMSRPDVQEAEAQLRVGEAQVDRARREGRPDASVFGMYMRMDAGFPQQGLSPTGAFEPIRSVFHYVSVGAMLTLPVRNRNQGAVAAAEAARVGAAAQLEAARLAAQA
jgi:cobalt-zinc-cadmium efflux system outer membrane protein